MLAIWTGVLISFLPAWLIFGQPFMTSLITSRDMLSLLALPVILAINPSLKELESFSRTFSIILLSFAILDALGIPILSREFYIAEGRTEDVLIDEDSFVMILPGMQFVALSFIFALDSLRKCFSVRNLVETVFFFGAVFLLQNRTTLFAVSCIMVVALFTIKGLDRRRTKYIRVFSATLLVVALAITAPQWIKLVTQTRLELGNSDYNRILAYTYFLTSACPGLLYYFTGTGLISAKVSSHMKDLMAMGIYNSDVGLVGMWNHYGIIPVVAILVIVLSGLFGRSRTFLVRSNAFYMLVASFTIGIFVTVPNIMWLSVFVCLCAKNEQG